MNAAIVVRRWWCWPALATPLGLGLAFALGACSPTVFAPAPGATGPNVASPSSNAASSSAPRQPHASISGKIAFSRGGNIWVFAGSGAQQATSLPGAADPAWSPDGRELAFDRQAKNSADLYVMPYPGGQPRALSNNASRIVGNNFWEMQPDWAPDGLSLAYVSDRARTKTGVLDPAPWRITLATGARAQLATANQYTGGIDFPRWRPSGASQLVYTSWAYDPQTLNPYGQLILENTRTGRKQTLTPPGQTAFQPSWSPDGNYLALIRREPGQEGVWIMPVADAATAAATPPGSSQSEKLVVQGMAAHPVWAPDGRAIAYIALKDGSFDLFVQALDAQLQPAGAPLALTSGWHVEAASAISWSQ